VAQKADSERSGLDLIDAQIPARTTSDTSRKPGGERKREANCESLRLIGTKLPGQDSNLDKENQNSIEQEGKVLPANTYGNRAEGAAPGVAQNASDPNLALVVEAWPDLPEAIRRAVLALVSSASS
jgi:hypothetical protein